MLRKVLLNLMVIVFVFALIPVNSNAVEFSTLSQKIEQKMGKINDAEMTMEIKTEEDGREMTIETVHMVKGEKFRSDAKVPAPKEVPGDMEEINIVTIFDGENMWQINPFRGKTKMEDEKKEEYQERGYNFYWFKLMSEGEVNYISEEQVNEKNCYHYKQTTEEGTIEMWIDKTNLAPVKIIDGTEEETQTISFSDFKEVRDGWVIPYKTKIYSGDELKVETVIKSFKINQGISDDKFNPDNVDVQKFDMMEMMKQMKNR